MLSTSDTPSYALDTCFRLPLDVFIPFVRGKLSPKTLKNGGIKVRK